MLIEFEKLPRPRGKRNTKLKHFWLLKILVAVLELIAAIRKVQSWGIFW